MKYFIKIDGGFSGIPRTYEGEIHMATEESIRLIALLKDRPAAGNPEIRDALNYRIRLGEEGEEASAVYNESQLPFKLRQLVDRIKLGAK